MRRFKNFDQIKSTIYNQWQYVETVFHIRCSGVPFQLKYALLRKPNIQFRVEVK